MIGIPQELKDFSVWLNPSNLKAFDKLKLIAMAKEAFSGRCQPLPPEIQTLLSSHLNNQLHHRGQFALRIYFYQLHLPGPISLDLRPSRFRYKDSQWKFIGQNLAYDFNPQFKRVLAETYHQYYNHSADEPPDLQSQLHAMRLIDTSWSRSQKLELENLFHAHFGSAPRSQQVFQLQDLIRSFTKIFSFIRDQGGRVPSEFCLIGLYLTSLYMTLEKSDQTFDVGEQFRIAKNYI